MRTVNTDNAALNPFSLMLEPERVLQAMERSSQLRGLGRRKLHPLDKPLIPLSQAAAQAKRNREYTPPLVN
jgi:hypothetical protein